MRVKIGLAKSGAWSIYASTRLSFAGMRSLPDVWNESGGADHRITRLAAEGSGERRHVGQRSIRAPALRRVLVNSDAVLHRFRPNVNPPTLRIAKEKALLRRESLDRFGPAVAL